MVPLLPRRCFENKKNQPEINGDEREMALMNDAKATFQSNESLFITVDLR
jgi:hypothetical protein